MKLCAILFYVANMKLEYELLGLFPASNMMETDSLEGTEKVFSSLVDLLYYIIESECIDPHCNVNSLWIYCYGHICHQTN